MFAEPGADPVWVSSFNAYDPNLSKTVQIPAPSDRKTVQITFGSGKLQGYFIDDVCTMGDPYNPDNRLVLNDFQFGMVTQQSVFTGSFDAIVGMAYPSMAEKGFSPWFDSIMDEKILNDNLFSFFMSMNPVEEKSYMTLGYYDQEFYTGEMKWHKVIDKLFWSLSLEDIRLNGESLGICNDGK